MREFDQMRRLGLTLMSVSAYVEARARDIPPGITGGISSFVRTGKTPTAQPEIELTIVAEPFSVFAEVEEWVFRLEGDPDGHWRIAADSGAVATDDAPGIVDVDDLPDIEARARTWADGILERFFPD